MSVAFDRGVTDKRDADSEGGASAGASGKSELLQTSLQAFRAAALGDDCVGGSMVVALDNAVRSSSDSPYCSGPTRSLIVCTNGRRPVKQHICATKPQGHSNLPRPLA